jgi:hypothetical protein
VSVNICTSGAVTFLPETHNSPVIFASPTTCRVLPGIDVFMPALLWVISTKIANASPMLMFMANGVM